METGVTQVKSTKEQLTEEHVNGKDIACTTSTGASPKSLEGVVATGETFSSPCAGEHGIVTPGPMDNMYFFEDEIFRIDKKGRVKFGLVIETSETYSGDEEDEFDEVLNKGEVRVAWYPEGKENVQLETRIGLADRTLMPGDVVRRLDAGKNKQRGYCREIHVRADVRVLGTKYVIKNVQGERLRLISNWPRDSAVCLDSWVGSTKDIEEKAVLRSSTGARIEISSGDFYVFKDLNTRQTRGIYNPHIFYPGNTVIGQLQSMDNVTLLTPKNPLSTNKKGKPLLGKFNIETVFSDTVWVHWQYKALSDEAVMEGGTLQQPNPCISGDDLKRLKRLNLFEPCMLQINDRNYLKLSEDDELIKKSHWDKEQAAKFQTIFEKQKKQEIENNAEHADVGDNSSVGCCGVGGNGGGGNSANLSPSNYHLDFKKKFSLIDTGRSKKFLLKAKEKLTGSTCNKKKDKEDVSNRERHNATSNSIVSDASWISYDEDTDDYVDDCNHVSEDDTQKSIDPGGCVDVKDEKYISNESANSVTALSTTSTSSPSNNYKHLNRRQMKRKASKTTRSSISPVTTAPDFTPKVGDELVTEALLIYSTATVVWQDGTIEENIPSTKLYPIHHLDNHEFFPGDFVISGREDGDVSFRDYGVIQTVDFLGRTALVKWFATYTSIEEARPAYKGETEVSVYDLKDHPDFQYHPGTIVIRVANFVGEDALCTAGQIIDNFTDGRVKVWWVDGHISMSWPQDLFEVGQYDHADWGHDSDDSWETESENSEYGGGSSLKLSISESHILSNIERARVAIARLEEIFNISPNLQSPEVMRKLMTVYKGCRHLDRLLNTSFFHEDNFMGLIERVRKGGSQTVSERAQLRKNRLFSDTQLLSPNSKHQSLHQVHSHQHQHSQCHYHAILSLNASSKAQISSPSVTGKEYAPKVLLNICSSSLKMVANASAAGVAGINISNSSNSTFSKRKGASMTTIKNDCLETPTLATNTNNMTVLTSSSSTPNKQFFYNAERNDLLNSALLNIEKAYEKTTQLKYTLSSGVSLEDSGNFSRCDVSSASNTDLTTAETNSLKTNDEPKSVSCGSIELTEDNTVEMVCVRLCTLLKDQLVKCINEIRDKYYKEDSAVVSEIHDSDEAEDATSETVVEIATGAETKTVSKGKAGAEAQAEPEAGVVEQSVSASDPVATYSKAQSDITLCPSPTAECFQILTNAPKSHKFHLTVFHPNNSHNYYKAVQREHRMLRNSLPPGVWVRVFEDRLDLLSVMIEGPKKTPYEDGLFFFDIQLGREYPKSPPLCHYISYCTDRLNPNLYEDGKVCVSLLGTWAGRDTEVWGPKSTLLQVIVSIQGLILVPEPYFNEAGYDKQKTTLQGKENSRMYNEMVIIKMVHATTKLLQYMPEMFREEIRTHYILNGLSMYERIYGWMELSKLMPNATANAEVIKGAEAQEGQLRASCSTKATNCYKLPDFPLVPASRGFCLTLAGLLDTLKSKLSALNDVNSLTASNTTTTITANETLDNSL